MSWYKPLKNKYTICVMAIILALVCLCACASDKDDESEPADSEPSAVLDVSEEVSEEESVAPPVTELDLTDKGSGELSQVLEHTELEKLNINGREFENLSVLSECSKLAWLDARGNKLDAATYEALRVALPECEILWDVPLLGNAYDCASEELELPTEGEFAYADFENIKYFPNLTELDLRQWSFTVEEMDALTESVPNVKLIFAFEYANQQWDGYTQSVDLRGNVLNDDVKLRQYLRHMHGLEYIDMCDCGLDNDTMDALRTDFPKVKFVWTVYLGQWKIRTDRVAFSTLIGEHTVYTKLTSEMIEPLKYCTELVALDLGHQAISDVSVIGTLTNLQILILADNNIKDISPLANLKNLRFIELFINYGIESFEPLSGMTKLLDLNIFYIMPKEDYSALYSLTSLERLWIGGYYIAPSIIEEVKANMPEGCVVDATAAIDSTGNGWRSHKRYWPMMTMFYYDVIEPSFFY